MCGWIGPLYNRTVHLSIILVADHLIPLGNIGNDNDNNSNNSNLISIQEPSRYGLNLSASPEGNAYIKLFLANFVHFKGGFGMLTQFRTCKAF